MNSRVSHLAVALTVVAGAMACSRAPERPAALDEQPTSTAMPSTATSDPTPSTSTTTTTTNTAATMQSLAPCETDMGDTALPDEVDVYNDHPRPSSWIDPPQEGFDWNHDGQPDSLAIGEPEGTVHLDWGSGSLTITGVRTDFEEFFVYPGSEDKVRPAAVTDVTGDGWLDLAVLNEGTMAVLAGAGDQTPTGSLSFDVVGHDTLGWRSNPIEVPGSELGEGGTAPPSQLPHPNSSALPLWDITADGVPDVGAQAIAERAVGSVVAYAGIPCTTE